VAIENTGMQKKNLPPALLTASLLVTVTPGKLERKSKLEAKQHSFCFDLLGHITAEYFEITKYIYRKE
jgi:hypothetical protein